MQPYYLFKQMIHPYPLSQTSEHLATVENMDLENIIINQKKIDLLFLEN